MAVYAVNMYGTIGPIYFLADQAVAEQVVADFLETPDPKEQEYVGKHGNAAGGYRTIKVGINWKSDWLCVLAAPVIDEVP